MDGDPPYTNSQIDDATPSGDRTERLTKKLSTLESADILSVKNSSGNIQLTPDAERQLKQIQADLPDSDSEELSDQLRSRLQDPTLIQFLSKSTPSITSSGMLISETVPTGLSEQWIPLILLLNTLSREKPPTTGSPPGFIPIHGDDLQYYIRAYPNAIVYIWKSDCEPCDRMKQQLKAKFDSIPAWVSTFSVYGPDSASVLQRQFDIVGGPTTLFFLNGEVDARLQGAREEEVLDHEITMMDPSSPSSSP
jgi:thiol-disulfide isomerase/thioredoxin